MAGGEKRLAVFLVEDEALIAMELEDLLEDLGHAVVGSAAGPARALEMLSSLPSPPDAAIVDANLGGRSSRPVVDQLRLRGIHVVVASGYDAAELRRLGINEPVIRKPYFRGDLEKALQGVSPSRDC